MYQRVISLFIVWLLLWVVISPSVADTFHAVVVADTNDWQAGQSFRTDLGRIKDLASAIAQNTQLTRKLYEISGDALNLKKVISTLENMLIESEDIVFFHYSGHGARAFDKSTLWPSMKIQDDVLDLDQVKSTLEQKNPRFLIILADTCNNFDKSLVFNRSSGSNRSMSSSEGYRQLFLNYRGHIIASGSKPGQYSWGNPQRGGFFTDAFLNSLNNVSST